MIQYPAGSHFITKYVEFFYLNDENNLPTLFSTMLLFIASLLNFTIYNVVSADKLRKKNKYYWFFLGVIFLYLGLDESLQLHDMLSRTKTLQDVEGDNPFVYYGWVIPYAIALVLIGLMFLRFVFSLPANTRNRFIISGFVYVGGAMGFELLESYVHVTYGNNSLLERALWTIEETMEMVGVILFIDALFDYISMSRVKFKIKKSLKYYTNEAIEAN